MIQEIPVPKHGWVLKKYVDAIIATVKVANALRKMQVVDKLGRSAGKFDLEDGNSRLQVSGGRGFEQPGQMLINGVISDVIFELGSAPTPSV